MSTVDSGNGPPSLAYDVHGKPLLRQPRRSFKMRNHVFDHSKWWNRNHPCQVVNNNSKSLKSLLVQPFKQSVNSDVEGMETFILMPFTLELSDISIFASTSAQPLRCTVSGRKIATGQKKCHTSILSPTNEYKAASGVFLLTSAIVRFKKLHFIGDVGPFRFSGYRGASHMDALGHGHL
jgi:hypothetical protein